MPPIANQCRPSDVCVSPMAKLIVYCRWRSSSCITDGEAHPQPDKRTASNHVPDPSLRWDDELRKATLKRQTTFQLGDGNLNMYYRWRSSSCITDGEAHRVLPMAKLIVYCRWRSSSCIADGEAHRVLPMAKLIVYCRWRSSSCITDGEAHRVLRMAKLIRPPEPPIDRSEASQARRERPPHSTTMQGP
jgi:hypothetical protein